MAGFSLGLSSNLSEGDGEFAFIAAEIKTSCEGITQKKRGGVHWWLQLACQFSWQAKIIAECTNYAQLSG